MRRLFILSVLVIFADKVSAYNPFWVNTDKKLIESLVSLDIDDANLIEQYFLSQNTQRIDISKQRLGFGWKMWSPSIGGGYISISARFFYYQDSIVSYAIYPEMPVERGLVRRYKNWYQERFSFNVEIIQPSVHHAENLLRPLKEYNGKLTTETVPLKVLQYMGPNSGTMYGYSGGYDGSLLQNRMAFLEISESLTNDEVILLMYSINPASRFTAIEHYWKNKSSFSDQAKLDEWVEINFREIPTVLTLIGCIGDTYDTRALVQMYSSIVSTE